MIHHLEHLRVADCGFLEHVGDAKNLGRRYVGRDQPPHPFFAAPLAESGRQCVKQRGPVANTVLERRKTRILRQMLLFDGVEEAHPQGAWRSEEHTSELQSLMRISYAVFCLKKKIIKTTRTQNNKYTKH